MKNYWFKAKRYGWGWYPATWQGWLIMLLWLVVVIWDFFRIDAITHSGSDALISFVPQLIVAMFILALICWATGEKPRWQWGGQASPMPISMKWMIGIFILLLVAVFVLDTATYYVSHTATQLTTQPVTTASDSDTSTFSSPQYGFSITYPNTFAATTTFASSYLLPASWDVSAPEGTGQQIVDLQYPGSNNILSAEVRVGASTESDQVASCTTVAANQGLVAGTAIINGATFTTFTGNDAAMSHFSTIKSYRIVKNNTCIAIDEIIFGTNPEVYSPPRQVPFEQATAQIVLDSIVRTFMFNK